VNLFDTVHGKDLFLSGDHFSECRETIEEDLGVPRIRTQGFIYADEDLLEDVSIYAADDHRGRDWRGTALTLLSLATSDMVGERLDRGIGPNEAVVREGERTIVGRLANMLDGGDIDQGQRQVLDKVGGEVNEGSNEATERLIAKTTEDDSSQLWKDFHVGLVGLASFRERLSDLLAGVLHLCSLLDDLGHIEEDCVADVGGVDGMVDLESLDLVDIARIEEGKDRADGSVGVERRSACFFHGLKGESA